MMSVTQEKFESCAQKRQAGIAGLTNTTPQKVGDDRLFLLRGLLATRLLRSSFLLSSH
jgi:hypothetical protein